MAIAPASVGTASWTLGSTASFTATFAKPSGLAVGDMMVGCFYTDGGSTAITTLTSSGWTAFAIGISVETSKMFMLYKVADSGDVAASNFTFTTNYSGTGGGKVGGGILRLTGFGIGSTPVLAYDTDENRNGTGASFTSFATPFTPAADNTLLIMMVAGCNNETGTGGFSGYTVSGSNPTWTERIELFDADGDDAIFSVATAVETTATTRTTAAATCSVAQDDYMLILGSFQPAVDASGTVALLSADADLFVPAASSGTTGTVALTEAEAVVFDAEDADPHLTPWVGAEKETTTWVNQPKP